MTKIEIIKGDITSLKVDSIVNAANTSLLGGGGVDGAIHRVGGKVLTDACQIIRNRQGGCKVGKSVITPAGNLPSNFVIHTVSPVWNGGDANENELFISAYTTALELAMDNSIKTIAFPNMGTGRYKFPKKLAAELAIKTVNNFVEENKFAFDSITFVCYDEENYFLYRRLLSSNQSMTEIS